jgi:hypothetical protein
VAYFGTTIELPDGSGKFPDSTGPKNPEPLRAVTRGGSGSRSCARVCRLRHLRWLMAKGLPPSPGGALYPLMRATTLGFGERHLRRKLAELIEHWHAERNHQGFGNELIDPVSPMRAPIGFGVAAGSAGSSIITIARHDRGWSIPTARLTDGT